jgi:hypothetical protein
MKSPCDTIDNFIDSCYNNSIKQMFSVICHVCYIFIYPRFAHTAGAGDRRGESDENSADSLARRLRRAAVRLALT